MAHSDISFKDYSPKSILITGEGTKACKEQLKKIGCKWNFSLKGWICSKTKQAAVEKFIETGEVDSPSPGWGNSVSIEQAYLIKGDTRSVKDKLKRLGSPKSILITGEGTKAPSPVWGNSVSIEQAYLIKGDTRSVKDELKRLGCVWVRGHGWMATDSIIDEVEDVLEATK